MLARSISATVGFRSRIGAALQSVLQWKKSPGATLREPSVGILLCKSRDRVVVEYALSDIHKPMGVSEYELTRALPDNLKPSLPSIEAIEAELSEDSGSQ